MKYAFIRDNKKYCPIELMCQMFGVSKSSYYRWLLEPVTKHKEKVAKLDDQISSVFNDHKRRYGCVRIAKELNERDGLLLKRQYVASRMKLLGIKAKARRKFKATTDSKHNLNTSPNILQQDFSASGPNEKWLSDITYIKTQEGWLYLCVFIDVYSRKVIGWSMSNRINKHLVCNALTMALCTRDFPKGVIVHTDRGSQYCSKRYQKMLKANGLISSMSAKGCCYDNAPCESFFHSLKVELVHDENYQTRSQAKSSIFEYINVYYNRKRRHSFIDYMTPEKFEAIMRSLDKVA